MPSTKKNRFPVPHKVITDADINEMNRMTEIALLNTPLGGVIDFGEMIKESSYGKLTLSVQHAMDSYIKGKTVYDFGAGNLVLSEAIRKMGAKRVIAIDKEVKESKDPFVVSYRCYFDKFLTSSSRRPKPGDVAFLSWPSNHPLPGLLDLLSRFDTIIYLGKNTDGSACGWPGFFHQMYLRTVLEYVPHRRNSLIIYGKHDDKLAIEHRLLRLEERAGGDQSKQYNFDEKESR